MGIEQYYWPIFGLLMALALAAIALLMWDNADAMRSGEAPGAPLGDVPTIPSDQLQRIQRARFERMDGVL